MKQKLMKLVLAVATLFTATITSTTLAFSDEESGLKEYEVYPTPHKITYESGEYILKNNINVVFEDGIDEATKIRLKEITALKGLQYDESSAVKNGATNILVGIYDSKGYVDTYAKEKYNFDESVYTKTDSYFLKSDQNVITVLGKDTDASFYGLTTLYHIVKQLESYTIRNFTIEDYADVVSRGFIEGYYGNPWSTEDRAELMKWSGYYKLNSYFYAPKDDPKHNGRWRDLYTPEEVENMIKPLAVAGNESKCRFVFALHPYMSNPIRHDTEENYQNDLKVMQAKFEQVIDAGVRQIAILADDAGNVGAENYIRMLNDMTDWLKEKQKTYSDLKLTLPFCTVEYMGMGENYYEQFPENVQIVMTGGRVWGEVSNDFTQKFSDNVGRGPYMWINWPCSDGSKNHLIMGGYKTFLHPNVNPKNIKGIVLNPMQQSEPSKVAIFGNAAYAWNIWDSEEEADKAWDNAFKYVDHNSAIENEASLALRELSKHMINQNMDGRVTVLQESVELKVKLNAFKEKLEAGKVTNVDADELIKEFEILQEAAKTYRAQATDTRLRDQIVYWLNCWDDTTVSAIAYLNGVKSAINGDVSGIIEHNTAGKVAFENSRTHSFWYINHYENAEVGVQHIVPFINTLSAYVSSQAETVLDPSKVIQSYITSRQDNPDGRIENIMDGDDSTKSIYKNPNVIKAGDYVGVRFNKKVPVKDVRILMGAGKDHFDNSKLEYTEDGETWKPLNEKEYKGVNGQALEVLEENIQGIEALAVRLVATKDNVSDAWLEIREITVNKKVIEDEPSSLQYNVIKPASWSVYSDNAESRLYDGNDNTYTWYKVGNNDTMIVGDYLGYDFGKVETLDSLHAVIGADGADKLVKYTFESSLDGETWTVIPGLETYSGVNSGKDIIDHSLNGLKARFVRVRNLEIRPNWGKFSEFTFTQSQTEVVDKKHVYSNVNNSFTANLTKEGMASLSAGSIVLDKGDYIGIQLDNIKAIEKVETSTLSNNLVLETSMNGVVWTPFTKAIDARYIRVRSNENGQNVNLTKFNLAYTFIGEKKVTSNFGMADPSDDMRNNGNVKNVFDGNLSTTGNITGAQALGKEIVFDLGTQIDFKSIRYYVSETNLDYFRDADFEVANSADAADNEWKKVLFVGDGEEHDEYDESVAKDAPYLTHDSKNPGYMYAEKTGLNVSGRFLRIKPSTNYSHRWVRINEISINENAYISNESNRDIVGDVVEEKGKIPSNMLDDDYATTYKASEKNASFTYRISKPEDIKSIRFIQVGANSNAKVEAKLLDATGNETTMELGRLNQAINEFVIPSGMTLLSISVSWTDVIPEIATIKTSTEAMKVADKTALVAELAKAVDPNWTKDSIAKYDEARKTAEEINNNKNVSQAVVDSALGALVAARSNAILKVNNIAELNEMVADRLLNDDSIYSNISFSVYDNAMDKLAEALTNANNLSQAQAERLVAAVQTAKTQLFYSIRNRELAILALEALLDYPTDNYTVNSIGALTSAKAALTTFIANDKVDNRVHPNDLKKATKALHDAVSGLVDVTDMKAELAIFATIDGSIYTEETYAAYVKAADIAKDLLINGTTSSVADATKELASAKANLKEISVDGEALEKLIKEVEALNKSDYTKASYDVLAKAIVDAKKPHDESKNESLFNAIVKARNGLVNTKKLQSLIHVANQLKAEDYTTTSYNVLKPLLEAADTALETGSKETVETLSNQFEAAFNGLEIRAKDVADYLETIKLKPADLYTKETYDVYKKAYDALFALDVDDTSQTLFMSLKNAFEKAELALKEKTDAVLPPNDKVDTGDATNVIMLSMLLMMAGGAVIVIQKRKRNNA